VAEEATPAKEVSYDNLRTEVARLLPEAVPLLSALDQAAESDEHDRDYHREHGLTAHDILYEAVCAGLLEPAIDARDLVAVARITAAVGDLASRADGLISPMVTGFVGPWIFEAQELGLVTLDEATARVLARV
jgi:hypothetical protein